MASTSATNPDTQVVLKINVDGHNRKFKLPLRDLGASTLPDKLRFLLDIPPTTEAVFERFSDSAAAFVVLDPNNASVYKQLYRAAKAKLKLRIKVTMKEKEPVAPKPATVEDEEPPAPSITDEKPQNSTSEAAEPNNDWKAPSDIEFTKSASVNEVQNRFDDLLISQPQFNNNSSTPMTSTSTLPTYANHPFGVLPRISQAPEPPKISCCIGSEPHVVCGAAARDQWFAELANTSDERPTPVTSIFSVYCNNCNKPIPNQHFHCNTCDEGDFDLCQSCIDSGITCNGADHWMIKRFVQNGKVINSTTEKVAPKPVTSESKMTLVQPEEEDEVATRTCNSCIHEFPEDNFVTCTTCDDYDLCIPCHCTAKHGHHPKHAFLPAVEDADLGLAAKALLDPGRNVGHNAICDGCDKYIYGVRNKCLDCPDWDFCSACIVNATFIHPRHRFVPIYEPINDLATLSRSYASKARHHGIYCDGPLCNSNGVSQSYIKGDRYKCAVCDDTDFCASCEASPSNPHNKTHPLIKFKTAVRNVSVTTLGEHEDGKAMPAMGDRRGRTTSKSTETTPAQSTNAATQVQTIADLKPTEPAKAESVPELKPEETAVVKAEPESKIEVKSPVKEEYTAHFVRDAIADGTVLPASSVFEQTWYLRNGGSTAWPSGCTVKFVGGDNMCAVDPEHPASVHELVSAGESTTCLTEVGPGQEQGFTVLMRTPSQPGPYISYWRLTGPDGNKFGHRLWCDIKVSKSTPVVTEEPKGIVEKAESEAERSQMIFPKLEKESPAASVHEPISSAPEAEDEVDDFDEFVDEPLEDDSDTGFMTDEEYDILDASDEEYLAEQGKIAKK
ncbi:hypothetical protein B0O99DRAFT_588380 [Bisporella sp. PMI_857]|nr:hypothetical protein B0O99DRAFT_588380 [Bisporella sp. PMI_857]